MPLLPEIIDAVSLKEGIVEGENEMVDNILNDKTSGMYCTFYAIGQILAPNLGSLLYELVSYQTACDIMAVSCGVYCLIFFFANVGFNIM